MQLWKNLPQGIHSSCLCVGEIMSVFLLSSCCLSGACDFSVVNMYCSYDRKIGFKAAKTVAVARRNPEVRAERDSGWRRGVLDQTQVGEAGALGRWGDAEKRNI